jgi:hypothetical protein
MTMAKAKCRGLQSGAQTRNGLCRHCCWCSSRGGGERKLILYGPMRQPRTTWLWADAVAYHREQAERPALPFMMIMITNKGSADNVAVAVSFIVRLCRKSLIMMPLLQNRRRRRRISTIGLLTVTDARPSSPPTCLRVCDTRLFN